MKRMKITILVVILMVLSTLAIGIAAEAVLMKNQEKNIDNGVGQQSFFDAEIIFRTVVDDGCGCNPIVGALITATGWAGYDEGVTDETGTCVLHLEINADYIVSIEAEGLHSILFDFDIIDDQYFVFHLKEVDSSVAVIPVMNRIMSILSR